MKNKIFIFIIGVLVGAIIATGSFLIYTRITTSNNNSQNMQMPEGNPPSMNDGSNQGNPLDKPGENNTNSTEQNSN